jgi:hypothetical protein
LSVPVHVAVAVNDDVQGDVKVNDNGVRRVSVTERGDEEIKKKMFARSKSGVRRARLRGSDGRGSPGRNQTNESSS